VFLDRFPFFQWCETTGLGKAVRESSWAFAGVESVHLLALALIGGAVLIVDMRLLGLGLRRHPVADIARDAHPWLVFSLIVMLITGIGLFLSESEKCYYSYPFWLKNFSLTLATLFTFTVRRKVTMAGEGRVSPVRMKLVALVSLTLWFGVGAGGRWIGFSG
jgi:hypothetical protein